ncbi:hypothetical protein HPG69_014069, partial [Diceros bicornis minor]
EQNRALSIVNTRMVENGMFFLRVTDMELLIERTRMECSASGMPRDVDQLCPDVAKMRRPDGQDPHPWTSLRCWKEAPRWGRTWSLLLVCSPLAGFQGLWAVGRPPLLCRRETISSLKFLFCERLRLRALPQPTVGLPMASPPTHLPFLFPDTRQGPRTLHLRDAAASAAPAVGW